MKHIYPSSFEEKIGFDHVRASLSSLCVSRAGRAEVDAMTFSSDPKEVCPLLDQTNEMKSLLESSSALPEVSFVDMGSWLLELKAEGSYATSSNMRALRKALVSFGSVRAFFCQRGGEEGAPVYPALSRVFEPLMEFPLIVNEIDRCIDRFGEVKDTVSEALYEVRRQLAAAQGAMSRAMQKVMARAMQEGIVDKDTAPSLRDGRMVIPVLAGKKRSLHGIVHDESASGKTVFIEPAEVVEVGNRLRELQMEEHREVVAVLRALAVTVRPEIDNILFSNAILARLDFIMAKASYAIDCDGRMPVVENDAEIDWYHAVHPGLLDTLRKQGKEVVPLDLRLDRKSRFLVVSGPNAGGKSVTLKTVGIVQYMFQCGMLPTLYENSHMGFFSAIFVDIGDEQSIENELSTYSSHLRNMKYFLTHADARTLILADEMGSGTEPQIGGALAQAILDRLADIGCFGIVTTHYQNLKTFAEEKEGFVNGAMLYDRQNLRPAFQLSVGNPGSSFALEIAGNIGLPRDVVEKAKEIVGSDYVNADKYLLDIARDRRYWQNKRQNIREKESKLDSLLSKYEDTSDDLRRRRCEILHDARVEAREILATANARIEKAIRDIRDAAAEKERTKQIRKELEEYKAELSKQGKDSADASPDVLKPLRHKSRREKSARPVSVPKATAPLAVGDYVKMAGGGVTGKILSVSSRKAEVAFGNLRTTVELTRLERASRPKESLASQPSVMTRASEEESRRRQLGFKTEIDVRGMRADEALQAVTYFLDDAFQFGASRLRILHGTGHGILKTIIRQQLKATAGVAHFEDEDIRFGGAGITVVDLE